jgi:hypothetical protein
MEHESVGCKTHLRDVTNVREFSLKLKSWRLVFKKIVRERARRA